MIDVNKVKEVAEQEFADEKIEDAKESVKEKLRELEDAKKVVRNIERELSDLYAELGS